MAEIHYFDRKLNSMPLTKKNLNRVRNKKVWIDLQRPKEKDIEIIRRRFKLHPTTIEDIKTHNTRIKIEEFKKYLFIVMYDIIEKKDSLQQFEIDLILGKDFLITHHGQKLEEFGEELDELKRNSKKLSNHFVIGPDKIMHDIMDKVVAHYFPIAEKLNDKIYDIEETVAERADKETLAQITALRKKIVILKRILDPQNEKITRLAKSKDKFIRQDTMPYIRDLNDDIIRLAEMNESHRDSVRAIYETYMSTISYNLNEIMKILSIVGAIMLPLTFITGLFGMNFRFMPGLNHWLGFWIVCLVMIFLGVAMLMAFQRKGWI